MNGCPHGHVCGVFGGSHPYLGCNPSFKLYFLKVAGLVNSMLLSVKLDLLTVFF